jgi:hypothetical protein
MRLLTLASGETMNIKALLLGTAACAALAGSALAQDAGAPTDAPKKHHHHEAMSAGSDRIDRLEHLVEQQSQEIQDLKAQMGGQGSAQVSAAQFEALQNQVYETQATVKAAATPQDKKIHFKGITFTFGGFLAMESVWRSHGLESDIGSPGYSGLPFPGPGAGNSTPVGGSTPSLGIGNAVNVGHTSEFRFSARQSRISGMAEGDVDPDTHLTAYGEFDFLGAAASANSNESNSYTPRVRNLYGTVEWKDLGLKFLFGQSWSLATLDATGINERSELPPPTIDAQYVPGFVWTRQPQLRMTKTIGDDLTLGVSLENPQTTLGGSLPTDCSLKAGTAAQPCTSSGVIVVSNNGNSFSGAGLNGTKDAEFNPGIQLSLNHVPDILGKIAWEPSFLGGNVHLEAFGMYRDFYDRTMNSTPAAAPCAAAPANTISVNCAASAQLGTAANHNTSGGGGGIAGLIKVIPGLFDVQFDTLYGSGIGRYGSGQLPDATYKSNGVLQPLNEDMEMLGLTLHATQALDIYVYGGREHEDSSWFKANGTNAGYGNPNFTNTGCFAFTSTAGCTGNIQTTEQITVGFWDKMYNGSYGSFRIGLQYSYTYDKAFTGVGGAPHTDDNMIFTSFRYYPF